MQKALKLLARWFKDITKKRGNFVDIIPVSLENIDIAVRLVYEYCKETQDIKDEHVLQNIMDQIREIAILGNLVGVAYLESIPVGIVYAVISASEIWDGRKTGTISMLYVKPEYRNNPGVVMALINAATVFLISREIKVIKISADSRDVVDKYKNLFGFNVLYEQTILEVS